MKRIVRFILVFIFVLFISTCNVSAESLDCSSYLSQGNKSNNVKVLKKMLNKVVDCNLKVNRKFNSSTKKCVMLFQEKYNLEVDGIVGPSTCSKLNSLFNTPKVSKTNAYVVVSAANIRKMATTNSKIVTTISMGTKVKVVGQDGNWYKVKVSNKYGYIRSDLISFDVIIVDISDQILYFYKSGSSILTTSVVTGMKNNHDTPVGKYVLKVANMSRSQTLRGMNDDGSRYASYVDYWMPFIMNRGIGFHDATWRSSSEFNKSTYLTNGSHGCVNMPHDEAGTLYNNITSNTAVIIRK